MNLQMCTDQKKCVQKPSLRKYKQREFACHFPINFKDVNISKKSDFEPVVVSEIE